MHLSLPYGRPLQLVNLGSVLDLGISYNYPQEGYNWHQQCVDAT